MSEPIFTDPPPLNASMASAFDGDDGPLAIPPLDPTFFSQNQDDLLLDDLDFDFSFDDLYLPPHPNSNPDFISDPFSLDPNNPPPSYPEPEHALKTSARDSPDSQPGYQISGDQTSDHHSGVFLLSSLSDDSTHQISGYLNVPSPESNGSNDREADLETKGGLSMRMNCASPESQNSENFGSNVSEDSSSNIAHSVSSTPNSKISVVDNNGKDRMDYNCVGSKIKLEEPNGKNVASNDDSENKVLSKRKKESDDLLNIMESRTNKFRKGTNNVNVCNAGSDLDSNVKLSEEEEKRKARLMRNRESAQLSRQRKKHYVEELEDKVRAMHSTIQDLNSKITYIMAENASLRQQMGGNGVGAPPPMPGMYPPPPMMYPPWMPCPPPPSYLMKPQGSQVPLVPIPRLKPTQKADETSKRGGNKKGESKKGGEGKTKKVASISFLGLLLFMLFFGGLVPMVNVNYGGVKESFGSDYFDNGFYGRNQGRVLMVDDHLNGSDYNGRRDHSNKIPCDLNTGGGPNVEHLNGSEPLVASLYVPRNDKLVKIDGNLIIHSVMASEKALKEASGESSGVKRSHETGLAVPQNLAPAIPVSAMGRNNGRHSHLYRAPHEGQRALGSSSVDKENLKTKSADGKLQQWFREGLAGPMLSSGMCTEVFHFEVSSGAIIPAPSKKNVSAEHNQNSTQQNKGRNRRILHGLSIPLPGTSQSHNISEGQAGGNPPKENFESNKSLSSMVVSVLVDPREAGDTDVDGMMSPKSLSRIFVVVLVDSVKYVTYSCMLPFKGSGPHLVTK